MFTPTCTTITVFYSNIFITASEKDEISDYCKLVFHESDRPVVFETLDEQA